MNRFAVAVFACCFAFAVQAQGAAAPAPAPAPAAPAEPPKADAPKMTCGQMMAAHAPMMAKMAELAEAHVAGTEMHLKAIDKKDKASKAEIDALTKDIKFHKDVGAKFKKAGEDMAKMKDMPACKHDDKAMADPKMMEAMMKMVKTEKELSEMMAKDVADAEAMMGHK
jgi:hypothetical protein